MTCSDSEGMPCAFSGEELSSGKSTLKQVVQLLYDDDEAEEDGGCAFIPSSASLSLGV